MSQPMSIGSSIVVLILSLCLLYLVILRLYFHPLAKFPGPKLRAITPVPGIVSLLKGRIAFDYKILHDKYGPVVRVAPNELAFNNAAAWEEIYGHRIGRSNMDKDPVQVGAIQRVPGAPALTMADDATHSRQRRAFAYAFSQKALLEQESIVLGYVAKLMEHLRRMSSNNESFNIVKWFNFTAFDVIGDLAFGESFGCLEQGKYYDWVALMFETFKLTALEQSTTRFAKTGSTLQSALMWLAVRCMPSSVRDARRKHFAYSKLKASKRMDKLSDHKDFMWYILKHREKKMELSDDEIIVNSALFIIAGSETTVSLLSGLTNQLLRNRSCYDKFVSELRGAFEKESDITSQRLSELPYFNACLEEGLRIFPPVPIGLLRVVPKEGATIDGFWVPGGTSVAVSGWAATHNPANFIEPNSFLPERWIDAAYDLDEKKASQPFSLGPRGCIGRNVAYMEMRLILGYLFWSFDIDFVDGAPLWEPSGEMKHLRAFNTWEKPPLLIRAVPVKR